MTTAQVLIVDDSKTAQLKLKRLLEKYPLVIDTAFSAEEAISFLSYNSPSLIFLDHHMRGMDGLVALKIIKDNPKTGSIPVIMYTSEGGAEYIRQARALGAIDILTKGVMDPLELEIILGKVDIFPAEDNDSIIADVIAGVDLESEVAETKKIPQVDFPSKPPFEFQAERMEVKNQMSRLFEFHSETMRRRLSESTEETILQLTTLTERLINQKVNENITSTTENYYAIDEAHRTIKSLENKVSKLISAAAIVFVLAVGLVSFQFYQLQTSLKNSNQEYLANLQSLKADLVAGMAMPEESALVSDTTNLNQDKPLGSASAETNSPNTSASLEGAAKQEPSQQASSTSVESTSLSSRQDKLEIAMSSALTWANDTDLRFDYEEIPLNQSQVDKIGKFVAILDEANFSGTVEIDVNFGNLCLERDEYGTLSLARSGLPIHDCLMSSDLEIDYRFADYRSVPLLRFKGATPSIKNGDIELKLVSSGLNKPQLDYPRKSDMATAGEWNSIALDNNRLDISVRNESVARTDY
ncbi:hypothetical protein NBRC116493_25090 [Aurantivibrio infirmus]